MGDPREHSPEDPNHLHLRTRHRRLLKHRNILSSIQDTHFSPMGQISVIFIEKENSALRVAIHLSMSSESFRTWLGNYHLTYLQAWLLGPHGVTFTEITDDIWWPLKCYINQNASLSLLSYRLNQWATWLVFRKGQADHFTNEWQGFSSERLSEEGQGTGMVRTRTMKPSLVLIQVLEATEKLSPPGTYHRWAICQNYQKLEGGRAVGFQKKKNNNNNHLTLYGSGVLPSRNMYGDDNFTGKKCTWKIAGQTNIDMDVM